MRKGRSTLRKVATRTQHAGQGRNACNADAKGTQHAARGRNADAARAMRTQRAASVRAVAVAAPRSWRSRSPGPQRAARGRNADAKGPQHAGQGRSACNANAARCVRTCGCCRCSAIVAIALARAADPADVSWPQMRGILRERGLPRQPGAETIEAARAEVDALYEDLRLRS